MPTVVELRKQLKRLSLPTGGRKAELEERLATAQGTPKPRSRSRSQSKSRTPKGDSRLMPIHPDLKLPEDVLERSESLPEKEAGNKAAGSGYLELLVLILLWYTTSIFCNETTKMLIKPADGAAPLFDKLSLTLSQLLVSSACGVILIFSPLTSLTYKGIGSFGQLQLTALLASVFDLGFITLNASMALLHVSLAMTLRAAEPVFALVLSSVLLSAEINAKLALSLLPVVIGAGLSAFGDNLMNAQKQSSVDMTGVGLVALSNVCFALRGILTKKIKDNYDVSCSYNLFFQLCVIGAAVQATVIFAMPHLGFKVLLPETDMIIKELRIVLLNGASFFAYLQLSWVVLARMDVVSHSMCNAMRRPATIIFSLMLNPAPVSAIKCAGITMACGGSLLYSQVKIALEKAKKQAKEN